MGFNPIFSVIIPTCDRNQLLRECLGCFNPGSQSLSCNKYEVIVVDDSKQKAAKKLVDGDFQWAYWKPGAYRGPAANRNQGAKFARGDWFVFCDDDCFADRQMLLGYLEAIQANPDCQVFEGRIYAGQPRKSIAETGPWNEAGGLLHSANFAIKRDFFYFLGGFDERFPYASMEDVDLALRIRNSDNDFIFVRSASVKHPWKLRKNSQQLKQHRDSVMIYLAIHPEELRRINLFYYFDVFFRNLIKFTIPSLVRFDFIGIKYELLEHWSNFKMLFLLWNHILRRKYLSKG